MQRGDEIHDELLWRLAMQLAAQLPVEANDRDLVIKYMQLLSVRDTRISATGLNKSKKEEPDKAGALRVV